MRKNRKQPFSEESASMASQLMGLSLFIMLLAFFIVLNAISTFSEQKARTAVASLGDVFGHEQELTGLTNKGGGMGEGDSLDHLEALFNAHLTGLEIEQDKTWGTMHIRLPLDHFLSAVNSLGASELKEQGAALKDKPLLPTLVSLMESGEGKLAYRMDIVVSTSADPGSIYNDDPAKLRETSGQLSSIATKLESSGLPPSQMSIGLQEGPDNTVDLYFRPYKTLMTSQKS